MEITYGTGLIRIWVYWKCLMNGLCGSRGDRGNGDGVILSLMPCRLGYQVCCHLSRHSLVWSVYILERVGLSEMGHMPRGQISYRY